MNHPPFTRPGTSIVPPTREELDRARLAAQTAPRLADPMEAADLVLANASLFRDDFGPWLMANWAIWLAFERRANRLWASGVKHAGARMIWEVLRYFSVLRERESDYKVNGNFCPDCARLYLLVHPERKGFFETRIAKGAERSA